ncbi:MAG: AMP-binding protein [Anaerolineaceae bacterium]|jgi:acyl-CoA synthetase (AMP-forming)/AMP-acid ligase II|nr:AMP-binding protein [Anaerolineaceae bacterium]
MKQTFSSVLLKHYHETPEKIALTLLHAGEGDVPVSYGELVERSSAFSAALEAAGIQPGEVVILIQQHGLDLVNAYFGVILHGAIPSIMPFLTEKLLPERYRAGMKSLVSISKPAAIITYADFEDEVRSALIEGDSVRAVIVAEEVSGDALVDLEALGGLQRAPQDVVLLQHSSGSTGLQKGVALSHQAVFNQLASYQLALALQEEDVIVSWLPLYHDMGLIAGFLMPLLSGIPLVLMSPFDWVRAPYRLMQAVSKYKGTLSWLPNFAYNFCAKKVRDRHLADVDLSSWRAVINCSEPMRWDSQQAFLDRFQDFGFREEALATCYAMAENVFAVTQGGITAPVKYDDIDREIFQTEGKAVAAMDGKPSLRMVSAGKPIRNVEVKIVTAVGEALPERQVGEIALRSDCMLTGYFHREDITEEAFIDGWFLTGDYGYLADGEVYISGRKKDLIIVGGKNVYPQDIEEIVNGVPGVHPGRVVAFGVFNEDAGTEEVAVVAEIDDPADKDQVADAVRKAVAHGSAVVLRYVHLVDGQWLVKTSSGKIARSANKDKFLAEITPS